MSNAALATTDDAARMAVGGNKPPLVTLEELAKENAAVVETITDLLAEARKLPTEVTTDEEDGAVTDVVRALQTEAKRAEALRVDTKAPFLAAVRTVDSYFNGSLIDKVTKAKEILEGRLTIYKRKKANDERERLAQVARLAAAQAQAAQAEAEKVRQEADRERQEALAAAEFEDNPTPLAPQQMGVVMAAENNALDAALIARTAAEAVHVKPSEVARNRSTSGAAASTLVETWSFEITDLNAIPLDILRAHIPLADIEKAVRRHVAVHKGDKPLAGVRIFPVENARVY